MFLVSERNHLSIETSNARKQFTLLALICLAFWSLFQFVEIVASGHVAGTNALSYCSVNAAREFLPWPAVLLGCTSAKWLIRIPAGCIGLFLVLSLWLNSTWGNSFNYCAEMSQYELLSKKMIDQRTTEVVYRNNPGAFSSFNIITRKETIVGPGLIFIQVMSSVRE